MLIFNTITILLPAYGYFYLNTSHVNLQQTWHDHHQLADKHLNTSHVNLQLFLLIQKLLYPHYLNTSHVNLQQLNYDEEKEKMRHLNTSHVNLQLFLFIGYRNG